MFIKIIILFNLLLNKSSILLFPGLGASKLVKNKLDVWPPKPFFFLFHHNEWINLMINDHELKTLNFGNKNSLDLHTNIPLIIKKNFYEDIMTKNENVYPVPYDFRLIHNKDYIITFYDQVKIYIETFDKPIKILTHSSGGLLVHYFLSFQSNEWKEKHIQEVIHINVPFGGLIHTLENLVKTTLLNILVSKKLLKSLGAYIINMPNPNIIKPVLIVDGKEILDYYDYFNLKDLEESKLFVSEMVNSFDKSCSVKTTIIYTSNIKTSSIINVNNNKIDIIKGLGDGTVPLSSLLYPLKWNQENLKIIHLPNYDHSTILFSKELNNILHDLQ
jgi:hypothetical protein